MVSRLDVLCNFEIFRPLSAESFSLDGDGRTLRTGVAHGRGNRDRRGMLEAFDVKEPHGGSMLVLITPPGS